MMKWHHSPLGVRALIVPEKLLSVVQCTPQVCITGETWSECPGLTIKQCSPNPRLIWNNQNYWKLGHTGQSQRRKSLSSSSVWKWPFLGFLARLCNTDWIIPNSLVTPNLLVRHELKERPSTLLASKFSGQCQAHSIASSHLLLEILLALNNNKHCFYDVTKCQILR